GHSPMARLVAGPRKLYRRPVVAGEAVRASAAWRNIVVSTRLRRDGWFAADRAGDRYGTGGAGGDCDRSPGRRAGRCPALPADRVGGPARGPDPAGPAAARAGRPRTGRR